MKAKLGNDHGISTIQGSAFNYDGLKRDSLDLKEAREILNYDVLVKHCRDEHGDVIPGINYLVKSTDGQIIPSAGIGDRFRPFQNYDFFDSFVNNVMPNVPELRLETVATLHGGGTAFITTNFGENFHPHGDESESRFRVLFSNDNTGKSSLLIGFTSVRVVCMNTLAMATREVEASADSFKVRHTETCKERVGSAVDTIYGRLRELSGLRERIERLALTEVNTTQVHRVLDRLYPLDKFPPDTTGRTRMTNVRDEVIRQFEVGETAQSINGNTAWKLFNALDFRLFNPLTEKKNTDRAELAYQGSVGRIAERVGNMFNVVANEVGLVAA